MSKKAVLAFGGNAILKSVEKGKLSEQEKNAAEAAEMIVNILNRGYEVIVVHGNGPQVGNELIRVEESITKVPPCSLDYCVAKTQGDIGHMLEKAIRNKLLKRGINKNVVGLLTQVEVKKDDPGFDNPSKPVGPYYTKYRAYKLQKNNDWVMKEIPERGYRRLVPSPKPRKIRNVDLMEKLMNEGSIVIAAGGGGIPVYREDKKFESADAVIDKDYSASMIADEIKADLFIMLTDVSKISLNWGTEQQKDLDAMTLKEAEKYYEEGHFPEGSMGPKVKASMKFVEKGKNREVIITSADALPEAFEGKNGTRIKGEEKSEPDVLPLN